MFVTGTLVRLFFRLFGKLLPAEPLESVTAFSLVELRQRYKRLDGWGNLIGFLIFAVLAISLYFLLNGIANWDYRKLSGATYVIRPVPLEFAVLAAFMGLILSLPLVLLVIYKFLGREEYAVYCAYGNHRKNSRRPYDLAKTGVLLFWVSFPPTCVLTILRIDNYTAFTKQGIIENPFWSLGVEVAHPYSSVQAIYEVEGCHERSGDVISPYHIVRFSDGTEWDSDRGSGGAKLDRQRKIMRFVAEKSGKAIRTVDFAEDITNNSAVVDVAN